MGGNHGSAVIPITGPCNREYTVADEQAMVDSANRERDRIRRLEAADEAIEQDPATLDQIRHYASTLIQTRPSGCSAGIVREPTVSVDERTATGSPAIAPAWPIGVFTWSREGFDERCPTGVTANGQPVVLIAENEQEGQARLNSVRDRDLERSLTGTWRTEALRRLVTDAKRTPLPGPTKDVAPGRRLSQRQELRISRLSAKIADLESEINRLTSLYGTSKSPAAHGQLAGGATKAFSKQRRLRARQVRLTRRRNLIRGGDLGQELS